MTSYYFDEFDLISQVIKEIYRFLNIPNKLLLIKAYSEYCQFALTHVYGNENRLFFCSFVCNENNTVIVSGDSAM